MKKVKIIRLSILIAFLIMELGIVIFAQIFMKEVGPIEGTGFVYRENAGAGCEKYDVDDQGNIYFAINTPGILTAGGISVYDTQGAYKYTLIYNSAGGGVMYVQIDEDNNINIYDIRAEQIIKFDSLGNYILTEKTNGTNVDERFHINDAQKGISTRERNGILYTNLRGTITALKNGEESIVFTIPKWQKWFGVIDISAKLLFAALLLSLVIPKLYGVFKDIYS